MTGASCRFDPFATPSRYDRYLRGADVRSRRIADIAERFTLRQARVCIGVADIAIFATSRRLKAVLSLPGSTRPTASYPKLKAGLDKGTLLDAHRHATRAHRDLESSNH